MKNIEANSENNTDPSIWPWIAVIFSSQDLLSCQSVRHWEQNLKPHCQTLSPVLVIISRNISSI